MKGIHALIFCTLFSNHISAGTLEMAQWIPWPMMQEELNSSLSHLSLEGQQNNLAMTIQGLTPTAQALKWKLAGLVENLNLNENLFSLSADHLNASLELTGLSINQTVIFQNAGNEIRVLVKASCTPIQISLSSFAVDAEAVLDSHSAILIPKLSSLGLVIGSYSVADFSCSGIGGINSQITSQIKDSLANPEMIREFLQTQLATLLPQYWMDSFSKLNAGFGTDLKVTRLEKHEGGVFFYSEMPLLANKVIKLPALNAASYSPSAPQLIISSAGFSALMGEKIMGLIPEDYNLQKIDAFSSLMNSRVQQYLVWPDLRRFPTNTPFPIKAGPEYDLALSGSNAVFRTNGVLKVSMGGSVVDYINWGIVLNTTLSASVKDSVLTLKSGKATLDMVYAFNALYELIFTPNHRISTSILKSSLSSFFSQKQSSVNLPTLTVQDKVWKLQNWKQNQDLITMDWKE